MARKVLVLMENFNELTQIEGTLRRLGFDVIGLQKPLSFNEKLISFSPDLVVLHKSPRLNTADLIKKIKKRRGLPKVAFFVPQGSTDKFGESVDGTIELPIDPAKFIDAFELLLGTDVTPFRKKLEKLMQKETGRTLDFTAKKKDRARRGGAIFHVTGQKNIKPRNYAKFTQGDPIQTDKILDRAQVQAYVQREEKVEVLNEEQLDAERKEFVRALYNKDKAS